LKPTSHAGDLVLGVLLSLHQLDNGEAQKALKFGPGQVSDPLTQGFGTARQFQVAERRQLVIDLPRSHAAMIAGQPLSGMSGCPVACAERIRVHVDR
jgi:hypothetical protein